MEICFFGDVEESKGPSGCHQSKRDEKIAVELQLVEQIRAEGLVNPETPGRPIVLCKGKSFFILFQGTLDLLSVVPLKTLKAFSTDVRGGLDSDAALDRARTNRLLDVENLSTTEFSAFVKLLSVYVEAEGMKEHAENAAKRTMTM